MKKLSTLMLIAAGMMLGTQAYAGDTTELLDKGVVELAPAISLENIHDGKPGLATEAAIGFGVADFMTISANLSTGTEEGLTDPGFGIGVSTVFTPVETEHFDMDVIVDVAFDSGEFAFTPTLEFNFDLDNDMSIFGVYLVLALPTTSALGADPAKPDEIKSDVNLDLSLGMYINIVDGQQLFIEGGTSVETLAGNLGEAGNVSGGYVSLSYNVTVFENFELSPGITFNIPASDSDGEFSAAIGLGGVFDIPTIHESEAKPVAEIADAK